MNNCRLPKYYRHGWLLTELVVSMGVISLLIGVFSLSLITFRKYNHYHLSRQHCLAAAQAQLESITATGKEIPPADISRLWPNVKIHLERKPGRGDWQGMELLTATSQADSYTRHISVQLSRYVLPIMTSTNLPESDSVTEPPPKEHL